MMGQPQIVLEEKFTSSRPSCSTCVASIWRMTAALTEKMPVAQPFVIRGGEFDPMGISCLNLIAVAGLFAIGLITISHLRDVVASSSM